jgi:flavin-dependent dehydrogenase
VELRPDGATLSAEAWTATAAAVIGADGANGTTARRLGLKGAREHLVALEADVPRVNVDLSAYRCRLVVQVGTVGGGYAWIFPKLDHLNIGVVGWKSEGPRLREQLNRLARSLELDPAALDKVRGYLLPLRSPGDPLTTGRCVLVGDAAGLIDPLTGEGMHSAFLSAKLAAEAVAGLVNGSAPNLSGYAKAMLSTLGGVPAASWGGKAAFDRFPKASYGLLRTPQAWHAMNHILQGHALSKRSSPLPASLLAKLAGDPGRRYLEELAQ